MYPSEFITMMEACWRAGASRWQRGRWPVFLKQHLAEPAERPSMEEICDGLSDMYSIEVLPAPRASAATKHRSARNAHGTPTRAHDRTHTRNHTHPHRDAYANAQ